tara:strand:- start:95 stop:217 length:123 start_codon:yes stop_codon:yes gene_type:complete
MFFLGFCVCCGLTLWRHKKNRLLAMILVTAFAGGLVVKNQ